MTSTCSICGEIFTRKRKEQTMCGVTCRQKNNARNRKGQKTGPQNREYKQRRDKDGYLRMYAAKHPFADGRKEIHVHVMVMEMHIGRRICESECVHHKNEIKTDNRIENLELMSHAAHSAIHAKENAGRRSRINGKFA